MVFQAVLQVVGPMLLELVIREVAVPAAKRLVKSGVSDASEQAPAALLAHDTAAPRLQSISAVQVVSEVPGRVRYDVAGLRGQADLARKLSGEVMALDGVSRIEANEQTGRLLVHFDPTLQTTAGLAATIDRARATHLVSGTARTQRLAAVV